MAKKEWLKRENKRIHEKTIAYIKEEAIKRRKSKIKNSVKKKVAEK